MPNAWVEHTRAFAKANGMSYGCAISDPKNKESYHAKKGGKKDKPRQAKETAGMGAEDVNVAEEPKSKAGERPDPNLPGQRYFKWLQSLDDKELNKEGKIYGITNEKVKEDIGHEWFHRSRRQEKDPPYLDEKGREAGKQKAYEEKFLSQSKESVRRQFKEKKIEMIEHAQHAMENAKRRAINAAKQKDLEENPPLAGLVKGMIELGFAKPSDMMKKKKKK